MTTLLTSAQMRAVEAAAIGAGTVTGAALMERAGAGLVAEALAARPELAAAPGRALVLCGPGNNGGDGYVVARLLVRRGWRVRVLALAAPGPSAPDAAAARAAWDALGPTGALSAAEVEGGADLVVDAVFGTGLQRPLGAALCAALAAARGGFTVAADAPSGLCLDSGRVLAAGGELPLRADLTVSFHAAKLGHYLAGGPAACGALAVVDIGLGAAAPAGAVRLATPDRGALAKGAGHKFDHGHAVVLAGGVGRGGAARLAARAALRVGAGLVTLLAPPAALIENAARLDAVMLRAVADGAALAEVLADRRITALCLGPGLGLDARAAGLVRAALESGRPAVLDADALTLIARAPELRAALHAGCLLTPHAGEFARLFPALAARLEAPAEAGPAFSRLDAAREAAAACGAAVLLKGPDTVIAAPGGQAEVHAAAYGRAAPWLATAGAGDVLAGLCAGLMARGMAPAAAAGTAAWLHVEAARAVGPGLIAEDLSEALPRVLRALAV